MAPKEVLWANLPEDNLCLIFEKLAAHSDLLRFVAVCKAWKELVTDKLSHNIRQRLELCSNQLPLLMVRTPESCPILYSLTSQSIIKSQQLSLPYNLRCSGSSYGWLAFVVDTDTDNNCEIILYNPFIREKIKDMPCIEKEGTCSERPHYNIVKVILSANPGVNRNDFYIVAIYYGMQELALLKYGQKSWTYIDFMGRDLCSADVLFFKGLLYTVSVTGRIASIDIISSLNKNEVPQPIFILPEVENEITNSEYLVETSQGDLLIVRRFYHCDDKEVNKKFRFKMFKLVVLSDENGATLKQVKSLGNDVLFIGDNHSMSVSLDFPECQPDSIYFTDEGFNPYFYKDGTIQKHYKPHSREEKHMLPPIWIIPTPNFRKCLDNCNPV